MQLSFSQRRLKQKRKINYNRATPLSTGTCEKESRSAPPAAAPNLPSRSPAASAPPPAGPPTAALPCPAHPELPPAPPRAGGRACAVASPVWSVTVKGQSPCFASVQSSQYRRMQKTHRSWSFCICCSWSIVSWRRRLVCEKKIGAKLQGGKFKMWRFRTPLGGCHP